MLGKSFQNISSQMEVKNGDDFHGTIRKRITESKQKSKLFWKKQPTWMSQEVCKWLITPIFPNLQVGYNPVTTHLLNSLGHPR